MKSKVVKMNDPLYYDFEFHKDKSYTSDQISEKYRINRANALKEKMKGVKYKVVRCVKWSGIGYVSTMGKLKRYSVPYMPFHNTRSMFNNFTGFVILINGKECGICDGVRADFMYEGIMFTFNVQDYDNTFTYNIWQYKHHTYVGGLPTRCRSAEEISIITRLFKDEFLPILDQLEKEINKLWSGGRFTEKEIADMIFDDPAMKASEIKEVCKFNNVEQSKVWHIINKRILKDIKVPYQAVSSKRPYEVHMMFRKFNGLKPLKEKKNDYSE